MPRIVSIDYVSTTLGLHKSVCTLLSVYIIVLKYSHQLEHTGTTITQTLSGLWLDSQKKENTRSLLVFFESGSRLQWLLNGFLLVNLLHMGAIRGLSYLNERRQNPLKEGVVQHEVDDEDEECRGVSGPSSSPNLPSQSTSDRTPGGDHTTSPLLRPEAVHRDCEILPRPDKPRQDTSPTGATTPAEVRRGKFFAVLCAGTVGLTWLLFFVTSFVKIRSRREREGQS